MGLNLRHLLLSAVGIVGDSDRGEEDVDCQKWHEDRRLEGERGEANREGGAQRQGDDATVHARVLGEAGIQL